MVFHIFYSNFKKMKQYLPCFFKYFFFLYATSFIAFSPVNAQQKKINVSGYSDDVIADGVLNTIPGTLTSNSLDLPTGAGDVFFVQGYSNSSTPFAGGLPADGQFFSSGRHYFQLAPYNGRNVLRMEASQ